MLRRESDADESRTIDRVCVALEVIGITIDAFASFPGCCELRRESNGCYTNDAKRAGPLPGRGKAIRGGSRLELAYLCLPRFVWLQSVESGTSHFSRPRLLVCRKSNVESMPCSDDCG